MGVDNFLGEENNLETGPRYECVIPKVPAVAFP